MSEDIERQAGFHNECALAAQRRASLPGRHYWQSNRVRGYALVVLAFAAFFGVLLAPSGIEWAKHVGGGERSAPTARLDVMALLPRPSEIGLHPVVNSTVTVVNTEEAFAKCNAVGLVGLESVVEGGCLEVWTRDFGGFDQVRMSILSFPTEAKAIDAFALLTRPLGPIAVPETRTQTYGESERMVARPDVANEKKGLVQEVLHSDGPVTRGENVRIAARVSGVLIHVSGTDGVGWDYVEKLVDAASGAVRHRME